MQHQAAVTAMLSLAALWFALAGGPVPTPETITPAQYISKVVRPHRGRILVVNFWATWCEPCREEMPALVAVGREYSGRGVDVALVSADFLSERDEKVRGFLDGLHAPFPSFIEDSPDPQEFINRVDPKWGGELPHTVIYGRDGKMRLSLSKKMTRVDLTKILDRALREW